MRAIPLLFCLAAGLVRGEDFAVRPALPVAEPERVALLSIERSGERLLAVGERGIIIYSDDDGASWQQARVPVSETLTALYFPATGNGWAVGHGGVILHSGDAGTSWQQQFDGESANRQWLDDSQRRQRELDNQIQQAAPGLRVILERELEEVVYEIEDTELALESGPADPFLDVWFADERLGWAVGAYGLLFRTRNGGLQWELATGGIENSERYHYYGLAVDDKEQMFLVGEAGIIYRSRDRGRKWERLSLDYDGSLFGVLTTAADTVVCFGLRGNIFYSDDAGDTWSESGKDEDPGLTFYGGHVLDNGAVVLVGAGGVLASSNDGGRNFRIDVNSTRSTFSSVVGAENGLLLTGMDGIVRIPKRIGER